jgi:hypothetical protein
MVAKPRTYYLSVQVSLGGFDHFAKRNRLAAGNRRSPLFLT